MRINVLAAKNLCTTDFSSQTSWPPMILTTSIWTWSRAKWSRRSTYSFNVGSKVHESQLLPLSALHRRGEPKSGALVRIREKSFLRGNTISTIIVPLLGHGKQTRAQGQVRWIRVRRNYFCEELVRIQGGGPGKFCCVVDTHWIFCSGFLLAFLHVLYVSLKLNLLMLSSRLY